MKKKITDWKHAKALGKICVSKAGDKKNQEKISWDTKQENPLEKGIFMTIWRFHSLLTYIVVIQDKVFGVLLCAERHSVKIVAGDEKFIMEKKGILWMKERKFVRQHIQMS